MHGSTSCPVCETETPSRRFPTHLATEHPGRGLREAYAYGAFWAGVLPALATVVLATQFASVALRLPGGLARGRLASLLDIRPEMVPSVLGLVLVPVTGTLLGFALVAIARGPGQQVRRGWQPRRFEYLLVGTWLLPLVGPGLYVLGAGRRFVAVRFAREKVAAGVLAATDDLSDARSALQSGRDADAAEAFRAAGTLLQSLREDAHVRNPAVSDRLGALGRACGKASAYCRARATETH